MIDKRLTAQHLRKNVKSDGKPQFAGRIQAYNNHTKTLFVWVNGKLKKVNYSDVTLYD
jgi:hypothetical protein